MNEISINGVRTIKYIVYTPKYLEIVFMVVYGKKLVMPWTENSD